ncbi:MAG: hypothetical protein JW795_09450 [Chitinivibrionales bacterium]|nr:hypothetical protein [Chitinivibrionales bacterium]
MKHHNLLLVALLFLVVEALPLHAAWEALGLTERAAYCIGLDFNRTMFAGTDDGVYMRRNSDNAWSKVEKSFGTVRRLMCVENSDMFIAIMGSGSKSDGVYAGIPMDGSANYMMQLIDYMENPQALTLSGPNGDTLYVASGKAMAYAVREKGTTTYSKLVALKIPNYCFGVEQPSCSDICLYSRDKLVMAGGLDRSPEPGPGSVIQGNLGSDSLVVREKLNVTSLCEIDAGSMLYSGIVTATRDSGIHIIPSMISSFKFPVFDGPNKETVNHLCCVNQTIPSIPPTVGNSTLFASVKSGVYVMSLDLPTKSAQWTTLGTLPATPLFIKAAMPLSSVKFLYLLIAGTDKGVYGMRQLSVGIEQGAETVCAASLKITCSQTRQSTRIAFSLLRDTRVRATAFDSRGRFLGRFFDRPFSAGAHSIELQPVVLQPLAPPDGRYILEISAGKQKTALSIPMLGR